MHQTHNLDLSAWVCSIIFVPLYIVQSLSVVGCNQPHLAHNASAGDSSDKVQSLRLDHLGRRRTIAVYDGFQGKASQPLFHTPHAFPVGDKLLGFTLPR